MAWALRWLSRRWGLLFVLFYLFILVCEIGGTIESPRFQGLTRQLLESWVFAFMITRWMLGVGLWMYFVTRRTLAPFRGDRLADLLVTPVTPKDVWPGLLFGPALLLTALAAVAEAALLAIPPLLGDFHYTLHTYLLTASAVAPGTLRWVRAISLLSVPLVIASAATMTLATSAVTALAMIPRGGPMRLVLVWALVQVLYVPEIALAIWVDNDAVRSGRIGERDQLLSDLVVGPLVTILLGFFTYRIALGRLRGQRFWNRLRKWAEA